jgi:NADPH-dependent ferric siderophore reductase
MASPLVRRSPAHPASVVVASTLTPRMRRITVRAPSMRGARILPAQDVELLLRDPGGRRVKRRYTIRYARADAGELDLDVLLHGDAPGASWARDALSGDEVEFQGPRGKLELRPAPWHVLIGDESALPAIATVCEALPADEHAIAVVEVRDGSDELPVRADVRWVHRGDRRPGGAELLGAALADLPLQAGARAYLMGETRAMVALRAFVEARGVAHDAVFVKGYWNLGRADRLAGRAPRAGP